MRACGPFLGGGSDSDSDFEPDWDSEPDRAGRGFSSSESLSTTFFSDPDPESESESDEAFCNITEKRGQRRGMRQDINNCHHKRYSKYFCCIRGAVLHLFLPSASCFLSTSSTAFLLWSKILLKKQMSNICRLFSFRVPQNVPHACVCNYLVTVLSRVRL